MNSITPEHHTTLALDGWPLTLHRYRPRGAHAHGDPVLLQHGLGFSARQFDLSGTAAPSLARWLAVQGYDVWACDLRGCGGSLHPGKSGRKRWDWTVDDHLLHDMPALIRHILGATQRRQLHWVGHSMGGILLLCHCALHGADEVASGIAAAAAFDYSDVKSRYDLIVPLRKLGLLVRRIPAGTLGRLVAPLVGRVFTPFETSFYYPPNMPSDAARAVAAMQHDMSGALLHQLATLFQPGGLQSTDGRLRYSELAGAVRTPILFLAGERDLQVRPEVIRRAHEQLGGDAHRILHLGRSHGQAEHYGHFDLFAGKRAEGEVFPHVHRWLEQHQIG